MIRFLTLCLALLPGLSAWGHGPVHEMIQEVSRRIEVEPTNARLYLQRGEYYRVDANFDAAYADFMQVLALDTSLHLAVDFQLAALFSQQRAPQAGLFHIQRFLGQHPHHIKALILEAGLYKQCGQDSLSLLSFAHALEYAEEPQPHHYLEIAQACLRADSTDFAGAQYWLEQGEQALGFNIVLRSYAIELDQLAGNYDAALAKVSEIIRQLPRHEKWLLHKAEILEKAGRKAEALAAYEATLAAIEQLPRRNRSTRAVSEWQGTALQAIVRLQ